MPIHREGTVCGAKGLTLFYQCWRPGEEPPRLVLANVHGHGDHSGLFCYQDMAGDLASRGYAVYGLDLRGHGRSPGQRGHITAWSEYREDVHAFLQMIALQEPGIPCFLHGHSMGGLVVLEYALHHPTGLRGVIATAPALALAGTSPWLVALARTLSRVWPRCAMSAGADATMGTRDVLARQKLREDPLCHLKATARLGTEILAAIARTQAGAAALSVPLLILQGTVDTWALPEGSRRFFNAVGCPDKEMRTYEGAYHHLHCDTNSADVRGDLERWVEAHLTTTDDAAR